MEDDRETAIKGSLGVRIKSASLHLNEVPRASHRFQMILGITTAERQSLRHDGRCREGLRCGSHHGGCDRLPAGSAGRGWSEGWLGSELPNVF